jgi:ApbE superfamily uncharacterized protein (UPF0280 family)
MSPQSYGGSFLVCQDRTYRHWIKDNNLVPFHATVEETDLFIRAQKDLKEKALNATIAFRAILEKYIESHPSFLTTLEPLKVKADAPEIVQEMAEAAHKAGVGPMAAVAGAIAEGVGRELLKWSPEVIVENGGDIFLNIQQRRMVGIYAGDSPFTGGLVMEIEPEETPLGICTSSGTVGHSLSFGHADAVIVLSPSAALADAAATATGNLIKEADDIPRGIEFARGIAGLTGLIIIKGDKMGAWGQIKLSSPIEGKC